LRAIDLQVTGLLVQFVFHDIGRHDFYENSHDLRGVRARRHAVPWMCLKEQIEKVVQFFIFVRHRQFWIATL
jgi:hypothetical protein